MNNGDIYIGADYAHRESKWGSTKHVLVMGKGLQRGESIRRDGVRVAPIVDGAPVTERAWVCHSRHIIEPWGDHEQRIADELAERERQRKEREEEKARVEAKNRGHLDKIIEHLGEDYEVSSFYGGIGPLNKAFEGNLYRPVIRNLDLEALLKMLDKASGK